MKLKTLLTAILALLVAGLLSIEPAEAKRFGGGGSFGKQYKTMPRQAQMPTQPPSPSAAAAGQRTPSGSGASRWLGPLAGLAAGGLLASLFFGDAFQGFQIMDFLVIAALAFGAVMLLRVLKRGQAGSRPATARAYGAPAPVLSQEPAYARGSAPDLESDIGRETGAAGAGGFASPDSAETPREPAGADQLPSWFDAAAFLAGAKTHFIRLQAAWDKADLRDIRDYTTPQLFAELQQERARLGDEQYTEVVRLQAEMLGTQREEDMVVISVRFSGLIREDENGVAEQFNEVWHVQHPWASPEGDWHVAGIQQV